MPTVVATGPEITVNSSLGTNINGNVAELADGRVAVVWHLVGDAMLRIVNPDGSFASEPILIGTNVGSPIVAASDVGAGFMVAWSSVTPLGFQAESDVMLEFFNSTGVAQGAPIKAATSFFFSDSGTQVSDTALAAHGGGAAVGVTFEPIGRFGGAAFGDVTFVSQSGVVQALPNTSALVNSLSSSNSQGVLWVGSGASATEYSFDGARLEHVDVGRGNEAQVAALPGGHAAVAWNDGNNIEVRVVGGAASSPIVANTASAGAEIQPVITALADGRFVVAWTDMSKSAWTIEARVFNADGSAATGEFSLGSGTGFQTTPSISAGLYGGFVATWQQGDPNTAILDIKARFYEVVDATQIGTAGADSLSGTPQTDSMSGGAGADTLAGHGGFDLLTGGAGADLFVLATDGSTDRLTDFSAAEGDKLLITDASGGAAGGAGSVLTLHLATQTLGFDPDGGDGAQPESIVASFTAGLTTIDRSMLAAGLQPQYLVVLNGDGSKSVTALDWNNQAFDHATTFVDAAGKASEYDSFNDDGSKSVTLFDNLSTYDWSNQYWEYDAQGRLSIYAYVLDDGRHAVFTHDTVNAQPWDQVVQFFAPNGVMATESIVMDDGTDNLWTFDFDNSKGYQKVLQVIGADHLLHHQTILNDDGSSYDTAYDVVNHTYVTQAYQPGGVLVWTHTFHDDGTIIS